MSEAIDKAELRCKKIMEYGTLLGDIEVSYNDYRRNQKEKIIRLAKILDESGHPKENISAKVCKDDAQFGIKERYVQKILPDQYKDQNKVRDKICRPRAANDHEKDQKQLLLVTNDGEFETIDQKSESALHEIFGGKSFSQMEKEIRREIKKAREETPENLQNSVSLFTDIPPELREKLADYDSMKQALEEKDKILTHREKDTFLLRRRLAQLKSGSMAEDLRILKDENNNLKTLLSDVDKDTLAKEG